MLHQLRRYAERPITLRVLLLAPDGRILWEQEEAA